MATLIEKLRIKPGSSMLLLNAPEGYVEALGPLPEGTEVAHAVAGTYDVVQLFARDRAVLDRDVHLALSALKPGGLLWLSWPKKTGGLSTDLDRDSLVAALRPTGWGPQRRRAISIDATWSGLCIKPEEAIDRSHTAPG